MPSVHDFEGQFVERNDIHERKIIEEFIADSYYSNLVDSKKTIEKLLKYEDYRNHKNKIYAVSLNIMIPNNLLEKQEHEIVKNFMLGISMNYKTMCYVYKFMTVGKGRYIYIIAFERQTLKIPKTEDKLYKRTMYVNKYTGRTTSSSDPDAKLVCKKGEVMKDKEGNAIKHTIIVTNKKRFFNYWNGKNKAVEERKKRFKSLVDYLKGILIQAVTNVVNNLQLFLKLKSKKYSKTYSKCKRIKILNYNNRINTLNLKLGLMQDTFYRRKVLGSDHDEALNEFTRMFFSIVKILENEEFKINSKNNYKVSISLTKHLSFKQLNSNLDLFVRVAERKIDKWHDQYLAIK